MFKELSAMDKFEMENMDKIEHVRNTGADMFKTVEDIFGINLYNADYKKLHEHTSIDIKNCYKTFLHMLTLDTSKPLYTMSGIKLAEGFERVVIGDYGAYIEYDLKQVTTGNEYVLAEGEEYRIQPYWRNKVKYIWYTTKNVDCKIYWQLKTVSYADYKTKKFYVSPYEVIQ